MDDKILTYKKQWFIEPTLKQCGYSFYAIRKSLKGAIDELKGHIAGRVLDLACGVMPYKEYLMEGGLINEYIGVDLPPTEYHHTVKPDFYWDAKTLPFADESFDWVIATEFLEHYHDTNEILKEINRVLKRGGSFFFTVPCIWPLHEVPYDSHRFTPYALEEHLKGNEFFDIKIKPLGGIDLSMALMASLWFEKRNLSGLKARVIGRVFKQFYKFLLRSDNKDYEFANGAFPSGLYGFAKKK